MDILLAGGAGYNGGVICDCLIQSGHNPIIVDSLRYGSMRVIDGVKLYTGDISDYKLVKRIFSENDSIGMCIHCAELSSLKMSVFEPYAYYYGNVVKSMDFFKYLNDFGCNKIIFCSSASVYSEAPGHVVTENSPVGPCNPFGRAKYMTETILRDFCRAYRMQAIVTRIFNAVGAGPHPATREAALRPNSALNNLLRVMDGELPYFEIAGDDWDTRDGTCIRDYIHILDMAQAHVKAVDMFDEVTNTAEDGFTLLNIGSGLGVTVKELISAFENITGEKIKVVATKRRSGDSAGVFANIKKSQTLLKWKPLLPVEEAILSVLELGVAP